ncbi:MAG: biotin--[acetyl-CoA-carboxylase] ligase [Gemmatimonadetes bacterium]|nr:biotin--[acetyl-CoA-carboxylase] ligase [Gemmatimonadota bacterium]
MIDPGGGAEDKPGLAVLWHGEDTAAWRDRWRVPELRIYRSVGSTNDVARELAEGGAPAGTVVLADEQTSGRGRRGRRWTGEAGRSLLLSMVLRPASSLTAVVPLRIGLAAARAIEAEAGIPVGLKWPNDLVLAGRKVGGVLCEGAFEGGRPAFLIAGVGINVLQPEADWPPELRGIATSVAARSGRAVAIPALAGRLVAELSIAAAAAGETFGPHELDELRHRDVLRGRDITRDGVPVGRAEGIEPDGRLIVRRQGATDYITTGTIRLADADERQESDDA